MTNNSIHVSFYLWMLRRRGGVPGLIATICLTGAAIMVLTQVLGRQARSTARGSEDCAGINDERRMDERRWRIDVSRKLEDILDRVPYAPSMTGDPDSE